MTTAKTFDPLHNLGQMTQIIAEVTHEPIERVSERLENERLNPGGSVADDFTRAGGERYVWGPHLERFYGSTNAFLYELAVWNHNSLKGGMRRWTTRHLARQNQSLDILSIGDGLGFDCLHLAKKKHRVTYFELPGISETFARKLFEKTGADIPVLTDPAAIPLGAYDAVTCFDVLEHVPDPPAMVRSLTSYLRPGGLLYVSAPFYMIHPCYPTHLRKNRQYSGSLALYKQAGLKLVGGHFTWYPIVLQKPGGRSIQSHPIQCPIVRLSGVVQTVGRFWAWPFFSIHHLRRMNNRRFHSNPAPANVPSPAP